MQVEIVGASQGHYNVNVTMKSILFLLALLLPVAGQNILRKPVLDKTVILTFDDAVSTHSTYVAPLLKKHGFTATFYVCEFPPDFDDKHKYMSWEQIEGLHKMGFEVANHTHTHKNVGKLKEAQLVEELEYIENKLVAFGAPRPVTFAYPGYGTSIAALKILEQRGYQFARAGFDRVYDPETDHPLLVPGFTTRANNQEMIMDAFAKASNGKIAVLTIHGVPDYAHDWVTTPPEMFESYLKFLKDNQYHVIAMRDLAQYVDVAAAMKLAFKL